MNHAQVSESYPFAVCSVTRNKDSLLDLDAQVLELANDFALHVLPSSETRSGRAPTLNQTALVLLADSICASLALPTDTLF